MTSSEKPSPYPEPGEVIDGKYKIERYIGEGGMGAVARAMHLIRKAPVALKFMSPAVTYVPGAVDRFINEAVAASALKSDHVVQVFDVGKLPGGNPYLVLELLDGHDAAQLLEREPHGIEVPRAAHIVLQVLRALEVAHASGIIHRDLKPSNAFLVNHEGDNEFVKLLDFGISKVTREGEASVTQTNAALGTPLYMSPEQARSSRDVDQRTDIYATGVILYELLCGQAPHMVEGGEFTAVLYRLFTTDAPPIAERRPGLPKGLAEIVHKALSRDPAGRFGTAREFAEALVPYCDGRSAIEITHLRARGPATVRGEAERVLVHAAPGFDPADVTAATQMGTPTSNPVLPPVTAPARTSASPAVRTDLSSAQDRPAVRVESASPKRWPVAVVAGVALAMGCVVTAVYFIKPRGNAHPDVVLTAPVAPPLPSVTPSAVPSAMPSAVTSEAPRPPTSTQRSPTATAHVTNTAATTALHSWGNAPQN
jgi:serine/threonine protein kinase